MNSGGYHIEPPSEYHVVTFLVSCYHRGASPADMSQELEPTGLARNRLTFNAFTQRSGVLPNNTCLQPGIRARGEVRYAIYLLPLFPHRLFTNLKTYTC